MCPSMGTYVEARGQPQMSSAGMHSREQDTGLMMGKFTWVCSWQTYRHHYIVSPLATSHPLFVIEIFSYFLAEIMPDNYLFLSGCEV